MSVQNKLDICVPLLCSVTNISTVTLVLHSRTTLLQQRFGILLHCSAPEAQPVPMTIGTYRSVMCSKFSAICTHLFTHLRDLTNLEKR